MLYDGQYVEQVPLLYDLRRDQLVMTDPARDINIQLLAEKVQRFRMGGHQFVRLVSADTTAKAVMPTGFYDQLLAGSGRGVSLLAWRTKRDAQEQTAGRLVFE